MNDYLLIASVLKPQGVRGECKLRSYAADIERFHQWNTLYLKKDDSYIPVALRTPSAHNCVDNLRRLR